MPQQFLSTDSTEGKKIVNVILWWSIGINCFLVISTILIGFFTQIQAIILDGVHSLSDLFSDLLLILALPFVYKASDKSHHFGHARYENLISFSIGFMIVISAFPFLFTSIKHLATGSQEEFFMNRYAWGITIITLILKEFLYRWTTKIGIKLNSPMLIANGQHHRGDVFSSFLVLVALLGISLGFVWMDDIVSIILGCYLFYIGGKIALEAIHVLTDKAPEKDVELVIKLLNEVQGIYNFHALKLRQSGPFLQGNVHLELDSHLTIVEAHKIITEAQLHLRKALPQLRDFTIHVDPYDVS